MKGLIPDDKIEEIKQRADIVELVSEYVTLKKAGRNYLGLCPFHKEKTPSFTVSRDKQMFYCFGCGEGGHVFTFLMKISNMTFPEAARHLAKKKGITIPEKVQNRREMEQYGLREQVYRLNEAATSFFTGSLFSPAGMEAREYLKNRGIKEEVARVFRLGYADEGWRTLRNYLEKRNIPLAIAFQAGLLASKPEGKSQEDFYDRFRGRLIFPIEEAGGQVIAFGGRVVGSGEPKYLNSPETPVFSKGKNLYGLNRAKEGIRKSGYAILVEGYFDLISLWNAGITNALASMGTALTAEQVELIRRYTGHVAVLFDADEAGKKALQKSMPLFLAGGLQAKAVVLPGKNDPDDYVRKYGRESLEEIIAGSPSLVDYYIEAVIGEKATLEEKRDAVKEALLFASSLGDAIARDLFLKRISEKAGIDREVLKREATRTGKASSQPPRIMKGETFKERDKVELSLIIFMLQHPESMAQVGETGVLACFSDEKLKDLGEALISGSEGKGTQVGGPFLLDCLEDGPLKGSILKSLLEGRTDDEKVRERYLADTIKKIRVRWHEKKKRDLNAELKQAQARGDNNRQESLMLEIAGLLKEDKILK